MKSSRTLCSGAHDAAEKATFKAAFKAEPQTYTYGPLLGVFGPWLRLGPGLARITDGPGVTSMLAHTDIVMLEERCFVSSTFRYW
jgi:hypothetical protein